MNENFSNGLQKLYNCVSKGLGSIMIPQEVRNIIDKEAKQIDMLEMDGGITNKAISLCNDMEQPLGEVKELYRRTCSRMLYQEMRKQKNIEDVVSEAKVILQDENEVSEDAVNEDWLMRFFNSIQDISNTDMQKLWGKVLAGEIKNPNSFTLRSLDTLSKITKQEAILFEELRPYIVNYGGTLAILKDATINKKYNISYGKIVQMSECGLIDSSVMMQLTLVVTPQDSLDVVYDMKLLKSNNVGEKKIEIPIYKLTQTGKDILGVVADNYDENYFRDVINYLAKNNHEVTFTIHDIVKKDGDGIQYVVEGETISISD